MKISKLLAEYLLVQGCDQNGINSAEYKNLSHENVSVLGFYQYDSGAISFTIIVDTIGVLTVIYNPKDFTDGTCFHQYVLGE